MHILILPAISSWRMLARCFTSRFWRLGNPGARRSKAPGNLEHLENLENLLKPNEPLPSSKLLLLLKGFKVLRGTRAARHRSRRAGSGIRALPDHMELYVIEKESLNINKLEHVLIEKVEQLFRDIL